MYQTYKTEAVNNNEIITPKEIKVKENNIFSELFNNEDILLIALILILNNKEGKDNILLVILISLIFIK